MSDRQNWHQKIHVKHSLLLMKDQSNSQVMFGRKNNKGIEYRMKTSGGNEHYKLEIK